MCCIVTLSKGRPGNLLPKFDTFDQVSYFNNPVFLNFVVCFAMKVELGNLNKLSTLSNRDQMICFCNKL